MSRTSHRTHPLLRGTRWRPARPRSRALWTAATAVEIADLFDDPSLRLRTEDFLRRVAHSVDDVDTLLVFDEDCAQLAATLSLRPDRPAGCVWDWIGRSLAVPGGGRAGPLHSSPRAGRVPRPVP